jgi:hypothetical protein
MYKRFSVLVTHSQKRAQRLEFSRRSKIAVIIMSKLYVKVCAIEAVKFPISLDRKWCAQVTSYTYIKRVNTFVFANKFT